MRLSRLADVVRPRPTRCRKVPQSWPVCQELITESEEFLMRRSRSRLQARAGNDPERIRRLDQDNSFAFSRWVG